MVPEANHTITLCFDQCGSLRIACAAMLTAIDLDHEPLPVADKVGNEIANWDLSPEMSAGEILT